MNYKTYGYVRVSTQIQNEARQLTAMQEFGVAEENIIIEKQSGKDFKRPLYQQLVNHLQPGDVLVVKSIDRLGRNYTEILEQWAAITKEATPTITFNIGGTDVATDVTINNNSYTVKNNGDGTPMSLS